MTISNFRAHEPLYIVIVRSQQGEQNLKEWARTANCQVTIEGNRMKIYDTRTMAAFQMGWTNGWESVTIWDAWNKRHIWLD